MTDAPPALPPANWYADPQDPYGQRWWNGATWSEDIRPIPTHQAAPAAASANPEWHPAQSGEMSQARVNFSDQYEPSPRPRRRGFLDSPFERAGTPRNIPGTLSLTFALLCFILLGAFRVTGIFIGIPLGITAIILAIVGIDHAYRNGGRRGTAIAGLVVGIIFIMGTAVPAIVVMSALIERSPALPSSARTPDVTAAPTNATRIPITTSTILEERVAVSIEGQIDLRVTVDCPEKISTARGSQVTCTGTYPSGNTFTLEVIFLRDNGPYSWDLTPTD